jgi:hypothetical protein
MGVFDHVAVPGGGIRGALVADPRPSSITPVVRTRIAASAWGLPPQSTAARLKRADRAFGDGWASSTGGVGYSTEGEDAHPAALSTIRLWDTAPANRADRAFGDGWAASTGGVGYSTEGEDAHPAALSTICH